MSTATRRHADEPVHGYHHRLIAERYAAWAAMPHRTGLDRLMRREAEKRAWWTLVGHLRGPHQIRGGVPFLGKTWAQVTATHEARHHEGGASEE